MPSFPRTVPGQARPDGIHISGGPDWRGSDQADQSALIDVVLGHRRAVAADEEGLVFRASRQSAGAPDHAQEEVDRIPGAGPGPLVIGLEYHPLGTQFDTALKEDEEPPDVDVLPLGVRAQRAGATEVETEINRLSLAEPWADLTPYLLQLPGIGLITAMTILSAIGEIERFPTAKKLVGYAGLGAKVHSSGQTHRTGGITKQGRRELRRVLIEAAWTAVRYDQHWKEQFEHLAYRIGREKAIVAIARKLLVIIWHVLTAKVADRRREPQQVARYFFAWGRQLRVKTTMGLKASEFARQQLDKVGLGQELRAGALWHSHLLPAAFVSGSSAG